MQQPWPTLAVAMGLVGLMTALLTPISFGDAMFAAEATALLVPLNRLEMRHDLTKLAWPENWQCGSTT